MKTINKNVPPWRLDASGTAKIAKSDNNWSPVEAKSDGLFYYQGPKILQITVRLCLDTIELFALQLMSVGKLTEQIIE